MHFSELHEVQDLRMYTVSIVYIVSAVWDLLLRHGSSRSIMGGWDMLDMYAPCTTYPMGSVDDLCCRS